MNTFFRFRKIHGSIHTHLAVIGLASLFSFVGTAAGDTLFPFGKYPLDPDFDYHRGYDDGYFVGQPIGYVVGFDIGLDRGETEGAAAGEKEGFENGWDEMVQPSYDASYSLAVPFGLSDGHVVGFDQGLVLGFQWASEIFQPNRPAGNAGSISLWSGTAFGSGVLTVDDVDFSVSFDLERIDWSYDDGYDDGYSEGYDDGKVLGASDGYDETYPTAYAVAYESAFDEGLLDGVSQGSLDGEVQGYDDGWTVGNRGGKYDGFLVGADLFVGGTLEELRNSAYLGQLSIAGRSAVPEPTSLWLALLADVAVVGRHARR